MVKLKKVKIFFYYYLPALLWMVLIYYFSSISNLKSGSSSISIEIFLRKGAHFLEYLVLTCLIFRIFFGHLKIKLNSSIWYAAALALIYALTDEYHQSFVAGRSGNFADVIFDFLSIMFFLQLVLIINKKKKIFLLILGIIITSALLFGIQVKMINHGEIVQNNIEKLVQEEENSEARLDIILKEEIKETLPENKVLKKLLIETPFTAQAPFAVWDEYHEEACEEASLVMIAYFLEGKELTQKIAEQEIQDLIKFQIEKYGDYRDSSAQELVQLAKDYYGIKNLEVVYDFSEGDLKKYLDLGNPIIIPAAGRLLGNPNFKEPGPLYHNLVLVGYNENEIITNDPGTKNGRGYVYEVDVLFKAIHDFTGKKEDIEKGRKAMIIIK